MLGGAVRGRHSPAPLHLTLLTAEVQGETVHTCCRVDLKVIEEAVSVFWSAGRCTGSPGRSV